MTRNDMAALIMNMFPSFNVHRGSLIPRAYVSTDICGDGPIRAFFKPWTTLDGSTVWDRRSYLQLRRLPKLLLASFIVSNWEVWCEGLRNEFGTSGSPLMSEKSLYEECRSYLAVSRLATEWEPLPFVFKPLDELLTGKVS